MNRDNDNWRDETEVALDEAEVLVNEFAGRRGGLAIPSLLGACADWTVRHGHSQLMKQALQDAMAMTDDLRAMYLKAMS